MRDAEKHRARVMKGVNALNANLDEVCGDIKVAHDSFYRFILSLGWSSALLKGVFNVVYSLLMALSALWRSQLMTANGHCSFRARRAT